MPDALISIKPRYIQDILSGYKRVEIRRRRVRIAAGTRLWIYATSPLSRIEAVVRVRSAESDDPKELWPRIKAISSLSEDEFFKYLAGSLLATAIYFEQVEELHSKLDISAIRATIPNFHPPQFFLWIEPHGRLAKLLKPYSS